MLKKISHIFNNLKNNALEPKEKKITSSKPLWIIGIVLIIIIAYIAGKNILGNKPQITQEPQSTTVQIQMAKKMSLSSVLSFKANLEPVEEGIVGSKTAGQVTRILFENGEQVAQGQALAILDDQDAKNQLRIAQIDLQKLEISLDAAQKNYDKTKVLYEAGAFSKIELEESERVLKTAQADYELKQVEIETISNSLNNTVLRAPISGEISAKNITVGEYVSPGAVLAKIKNTSSIKAVIQLQQSDLAKVSIGQEVTLKISQNDGAGYKGTVKSMVKSANASTRVFDCQVQMNNAEGRLYPGTFGYVEIPDPEKKECMVIPLAALAGNEGNYSVFTVQENIARRRSVGIGVIHNELVEVLTGLQAGEEVIVTNLNALADGYFVKVTEQGAERDVSN